MWINCSSGKSLSAQGQNVSNKVKTPIQLHKTPYYSQSQVTLVIEEIPYIYLWLPDSIHKVIPVVFLVQQEPIKSNSLTEPVESVHLSDWLASGPPQHTPPVLALEAKSGPKNNLLT